MGNQATGSHEGNGLGWGIFKFCPFDSAFCLAQSTLDVMEGLNTELGLTSAVGLRPPRALPYFNRRMEYQSYIKPGRPSNASQQNTAKSHDKLPLQYTR